MSRLEDWPHRLQELLTAQADERFVWGENDCCLWVGRAVEAVTGVDPISEWRGRCTTARGAAKILKKHFGGDLVTGWTKVLGDPIPVLFAGRGDVAVVLDADGQQCCGVVDLSGERVCCLSLDGLEYMPVASAIAVWRI